MTIDASDLDERRFFGPCEWVHPSKISGYSFDDEAALNRWLRTGPRDEVSKFEDESDQWPPIAQKITDYLVDCIKKRQSLIESGNPVPPSLNFAIDDFIDATAFLMIVLESSFPAFMMGSLHFIITQSTAKYILHRFRKLFEEESRPLVKSALRDFLVELYLYDLYFEPKDSPFAIYLDTEDIDFLRKLCRPGWENIHARDADG